MRSHARAVAVAALLLVAAVSLPATPAAAGVDTDPAASAAPAEITDPADCFGSGEDLRIGGEGPAIDASLYTSLFANLPGEGAFGVSLAGTTGEHRVVALRAGVVFAGVGDVSGFLADPLSRFGLAFDYRFELPTLSAATGTPIAYEDSDPPVEGVREAECST